MVIVYPVITYIYISKYCLGNLYIDYIVQLSQVKFNRGSINIYLLPFDCK